MVMCACFLAILVGAAIGQTPDVRPPKNREIPLSTDHALAGIEQLGIMVAMRGTEPLVQQIELPKLKAQVVGKLGAAGIRHVESETALVPRLVVRIEGMAIPACDTCVWRVQLALARLVTLPGRPDAQFQAEVWQGGPVTAVVARQEAAEAISAAVLAQAEAFVAAHKAARSPLLSPPDIKSNVSAPTAAGYAFVSSKSSQVFHRPDCRWAQNIASGNLVGYNSRQEAVQAGKRPCKTCQP